MGIYRDAKLITVAIGMVDSLVGVPVYRPTESQALGNIRREYRRQRLNLSLKSEITLNQYNLEIIDFIKSVLEPDGTIVDRDGKKYEKQKDILARLKIMDWRITSYHLREALK